MTRRSALRARIAQAMRAATDPERPALPGIAQPTARAILQREAERPMRAGNAELPYASLFGTAHHQQELFT